MWKTSKPKAEGNQKVRNATRVVVDGIEFRSKLEGYTYGLAKQLGVPLVYEARRFVLVPSFKYNGVTQRGITHQPDFTDPNPQLRYILEIKGFANDTYPLYRKLLLRHLLDEGLAPKFYLATNQKEVQAALLDIKQTFYA